MENSQTKPAWHPEVNPRVDLRNLAHNRKWFAGLGVVLVVLGMAALALPWAAALAVEIMVGWLLLISGALNGVQAFRHNDSSRGFHILSAVLFLLAGVLLLANPMEGVLTLTLLMGLLFALQGAIKLSLAFRHRPHPGWGWLGLNGVLSLFLAFLIVLGWPATAGWAIGLLLGLELIFTGLATIMVTMAASRQAGG